ncbi:C2H2-type domain-containing protein [Mycena venus]|uniref:C2H2-type domain-containing protein n=1 Tax=Mycena venus TaxID=2733690 RepID=A0A8H6WRB8_9AGAR|nr:C2H2-type domain-containing protein [Mycena venus]
MVHGISYTCPECQKECGSPSGLTRHRRAKHRQFTPAPEGEDENSFQRRFHPTLNALPCDAAGQYLPPFAPPAPLPAPPADGQDPAAWAPFGSRLEFDFAQYHFVELQTSERYINTALDLWAASVMKSGDTVPWKNAAELYATIDEIQQGHMPWKTYEMRYTGPLPAGTPPKWMTQTYEVCTRNLRDLLHHQLESNSFKDHVDMIPYQQFNHDGHRVWSNLMSGDWAWKQADLIATNEDNHGCTRHRTSRISSSLHFLQFPKLAKNIEQVWLAAVVQNWCPKCDARPDHLDTDSARLRTRTKTEALIECFDPGILWDDYGVRADIVPFTNDFPRADIHELLSADLLHQVIKGTFKDHLVSWVNEYLHLEHGEKRALEIIQDIDRRLSAVPEFPGLRRFPDGRDFNQWTGDDSKALMKIYLAAIAGYLPSNMRQRLNDAIPRASRLWRHTFTSHASPTSSGASYTRN